MIYSISSIHWLGVLVAFVPYFLLGAIWFLILFKRSYAIALGKTPETLHNSAPIFMIGPAICSLVITITCALLMHLLEIETYTRAIEFAFIVGLGYLFANTMNIAINPNIPKPILYGLISGTFHQVGILIVCLVLVAMK